MHLLLGVYASNAFVLSRAFSSSYKILEGKNRGSCGGFICDILIEDGFFGDEHSFQQDRSMLNQSGINISADPAVTDPLFKLACHLTVCRISVGRKMCCMIDRGKEESNVCLLWFVYHSVTQKN